MAIAKTAKRKMTMEGQPRPEEIREDQTVKAQGFFGPIRHASGASSTELSVGYGEPTSRAYTHKSDRLYPSMVPTLTRGELDAVVGGGEWPDAVYDKARAYGEQRLAQGKSPFAKPGEQYPAPGYEDQFMQQYPSAVMSYPDRTVGYQYAAGAPVTPYMSPVASQPIPEPPMQSGGTIARRVKSDGVAPVAPPQPARSMAKAAAASAPEQPAPYGVVFDGNKVIVGVPHGQDIPMDKGLKRRIREIGKQHGFYYEGDGGDKKLFPAQYKGSWDDKMSKDIKGYPPEFLSAMFGASDMAKQVKMVEDPKRTVFESLLRHNRELSPLKGKRFSDKELTEYLTRISDADTDFAGLARQPATRENVERFFSVGAAKAFPENWEEYPHNVGKAMKDFLDRRDKFLLSQDRGVYFVGAGHLRNMQKLDPKLKVLGGEKAE